MGKHDKQDERKKHDKGDQRQGARRAPGPEDARVVLELYDLRREAVMRQSRDTLVRWRPERFEDLQAIATFDAQDNAAFRQVSSYFELAFGLARRGAVDAELVAEACGEGLLLFAKVQPFLERFRAEVSPLAFRNAEWVATHTEAGRERLAMFQRRLGTGSSDDRGTGKG